MRFNSIILLCLLGTLPCEALLPAYEQAPIFYSEAAAVTPLTKIWDRINNGEDLLSGSTAQEKLEKLLKLLAVPIESQVLVYSKTSAQESRISPDRPRAIYFSDNAYVGWVQYGNIEVTTFDEKLGMVFHLIDITSEEAPRMTRPRSCMECHGSAATSNYPGLLIRSVYTQKDGQPIYHAGTFRTNHSSPLSQRWGGWYVTGSADGQKHLGNILASEEPTSRKISAQPMAVTPIKSLHGIVDTDPYLAGAASDIVALMVLEHQLSVHNALVEGNLATRQALYRDRKIKESFDEPIDSPLSETNQSLIHSLADRIVGKMLFADEHSMEDSGVEGSNAFQTAFSKNAKKSSEHRSLKDMRLYERLFKYRCSYLIYSEAFQHLPKELKDVVLEKIKVALTDSENRYSHLSKSEKKRILNILTETVPGFKEV